MATLTIGVIGDFGVKNDNSYLVSSMVKSWAPSFIVTTGDNIYSEPTIKNYESIIGSLYSEFVEKPSTTADPLEKTNCKVSDEGNMRQQQHQFKLIQIDPNQHKTERLRSDIKFFPCVGNHDYPFNSYSSYFNLPTYYGLECFHYHSSKNSSAGCGGLVKLLSINDYMDPDGSFNNPDSIQAKWLHTQLTLGTSEEPFTWTIIYFHHPLIWSSKKNVKRKVKKSTNNNPSTNTNKFPFEKYKISLILNGHMHWYERFNLHGITNVIIGTSGHSLKSKPKIKLPECICIDDSGYGALKLEIGDTNIKGSYYTIVNQQRSSNNEHQQDRKRIDGRGRSSGRDHYNLIDEFLIVK